MDGERAGDSIVGANHTEDITRDIKVAIIGNVDSGKSTLVGVLTKGQLDDGRGKARSKVFKFDHEAANGRTSSIAQEIMGFRENGEQIAQDRDRIGVQSAAARNAAWNHVLANSSHVVTFIDLCGHEKYLKTTIYGLVGLCPDHAMIVVNANAGFQRMSREHLGIALSLRIPITLVVTKIDITPKQVLEENMAFLLRLVGSSAVKKEPIVVKDAADTARAVEGVMRDQAIPIICVSNVTGEGMNILKAFVHRMPSRLKESGLFRSPSSSAEFHIDSVYNVTGVGTVVAGLMRAGRIRPNQQLMLGPDKSCQFIPVLVRTIHHRRAACEMVESGQAACFSLRSLDKKIALKKAWFRKGVVLLDAALRPRATWEFKAEVVILHHATTIRERYQAMIHCGTVRQAAIVKEMSQDLLRTGDRAIVTFRFLYHGEHVNVGSTILFREGRTKGIGRVVELIDESAAEEKDWHIRKT